MAGFNEKMALGVVADSWDSLRRVDVFRLFDSSDSRHWDAIFERLSEERPDLVAEAEDALEELTDGEFNDDPAEWAAGYDPRDYVNEYEWEDYGGVLGADGYVYSDADPGL